MFALMLAFMEGIARLAFAYLLPPDYSSVRGALAGKARILYCQAIDGAATLSGDYLSLQADHQAFDGYLPSGLVSRFLGQAQQSAAAWHLHDHHGERVDFGIVDERLDFFDIDVLTLVKLGTRDHQFFTLEMFLVEVAQRISSAIGCQQQIRALEVRSIRRY